MRSIGDKTSKSIPNSGIINSLRSGLYQGVKTLGLSAVGTAALVGAHHLGRKQYDANARLSDYVQGLAEVITDATSGKKGRAIIEQRLASVFKFKANPVTAKADPVIAEVYWVSGVADLTTNEFAVVGIDRDRQICWQTTMPERVHDILIQPHQSSNLLGGRLNSNTHVAVMGRRPSEWFWVLQAHNGELLHSIKADKDRHFYGHACYSLEGDLLYVTENNTQDFSGVIGIYDVTLGYKKIGEFATQGIGPHEIVMHPDGETLVIANGGIKTERASREELNIDSMQPSLVYLDRHDGKLIEQVFPEHNQMSVRHLAMHENGTVVIGIQFQGERHLNVPMVLTHRLGQSKFTPLLMTKTDSNKSNTNTEAKVGSDWHRFHHYIASVTVDSKQNLVCATSPIGGCAAVFDLVTGCLIQVTDLPDCAGVAIYPSSYSASQPLTHSLSGALDSQSVKGLTNFLVSDGQGALSQIKVNKYNSSFSVKVEKVQQPYAFDNHLNVIERG